MVHEILKIWTILISLSQRFVGKLAKQGGRLSLVGLALLANTNFFFIPPANWGIRLWSWNGTHPYCPNLHRLPGLKTRLDISLVFCCDLI